VKLELKNVCLSYGGKTVLQEVSLSVDGGITVLLGRNGAGKTSLLRCLTGEKRDFGGEITVDGTDVRRLQPRDRARLVGYLPQELPTPKVTVAELVAFGRSPYLPLTGKLRDADEAAVEKAMELTGVSCLSGRLVDSLSGGERQKAFLAMVLAQETPLVVLDEPTAQLDAAARLELCALLKTLRDRTGRHFLVVMHELPEALVLADRVVVLHEHTMAFDGTPEACLRQNIPQTCFGITLTGNAETGFAVKPGSIA